MKKARRRQSDCNLTFDPVCSSEKETSNVKPSNVCLTVENNRTLSEPKETTNKRVPTRFYLDYENVREGGLDGVLNLPEGDEIVVVYTENAHNASWDLYSILRSRTVIPVKAPTGDQSADKRLIAQLAADVGVNGSSLRYVVVTGDKGFVDVIGFLKREYGVDVERCESIRASLFPSSSKNAVSPPQRVEARQPEKNEADREKLFLKYREIVRNQLDGVAVPMRLKISDAFEDDYRANLSKPQPPDLSILLHNAFVKVLGMTQGRERYAFYKETFGL